MKLENYFSIRQFKSEDAALMVTFLRSQDPEYMRFFYAVTADESALKEVLSNARKDIYSGIFWQTDLVGIFMLRGWDEGYEIPSLGTVIDEKFRGQSILGLTFEIAKLICRLAGVKGFMVKIHPDNTAVRSIQEKYGFYQTGIEEATGNIILFLNA